MTAASRRCPIRDPRHGAGRASELDKAFAACFRLARERANCRRRPILRCSRNSPPRPSIRSQFAPAARMPRKDLEAIVKGALDVMLRA